MDHLLLIFLVTNQLKDQQLSLLILLSLAIESDGNYPNLGEGIRGLVLLLCKKMMYLFQID